MTTETHEATIRQVLIDLVNEQVERGDSPADASAAVFKELDPRLRKQFVAEFGPLMVYELWRARTRNDRDMPTPGERRIDIGKLGDPKSVFDALYKIDDDWIALGDLTKAQCATLRENYAKSATGHARRMLFFAALADKLDGHQIVRRRLTEEEVIAMRQGFESWTMPDGK